jgi:phospholipid/cholesterol/gamma-HCH transport system permease protein
MSFPMLKKLGQSTRLTGAMFSALFFRKPEIHEWIRQCYTIGVRSVSIATITAFFTGMVLALQSAYALAKFGSDMFIADLVSLSIVRELGPVLTALLVGGRVGAGITAELGSMKITQQIDALRAMATNPVYKLVVPRVVACVITLPLLTILADFVGVIGGLILSSAELHVNGYFYISRVLTALSTLDFVSGIGKTFFFGFLIGIIACNGGMNVHGGADGVGKATTQTVVFSSIAILISNFFLTKTFYLVFGA